MKIFRLEETSSTNTVARELAERGERGPLWVVAERQTAGRGRLDRSWISRVGNLYASALVPKPDSPPSAMAFVSAVAVADALATFLDRADIRLKWPNDVLLHGRKVSGILCESVEDRIICGIGINVAHHPSDTRWPATNLNEHGSACNVLEVLDALRDSFARAVDTLKTEGWSAISDRWLANAYGLGSEVVVDAGSRRLAGRFRGLGPQGELLLSTPSGTTSIVAGDVTYRG